MLYVSHQVSVVVVSHSAGTGRAQQALFLRQHPAREQGTSLLAHRHPQPHKEGPREKTNSNAPLHICSPENLFFSFYALLME